MASSNQSGNFDLKTICAALGSIEHKRFKIGVQLGIPRSKLLLFMKDEDPLSAIVDYWLRGNVAESASPISWDSIVLALKSDYVDESGLAEKIRKDYCRQEGTDSSNQTTPGDKCGKKEVSQAKEAGDNSPATPSAQNTEEKKDQDIIMMQELSTISDKNLKEIVAKYVSYVNCLCATLQEKGVSVDALRSYLLSMPAVTNSSEQKCLALLSEQATQLKKCATITDIFNLLIAKCASFLNYNIFQFIQERYDIVTTEEKRLQYPDHLKEYTSEHKISEFDKICPLLKPKNGSKELLLRLDIETTSCLTKLTDLKKLVAETMEISLPALKITGIEKDRVIVKFSIPAFVADIVFTPDKVFTPKQEEKLQAASVQWLECNGCMANFERQKFDTGALQKLEEHVTCSICLSTYTDPKLLHCNHSYCQQCLVGLVQQDTQGPPTLTCPTCRQVTPVANGVAGLPADFRANQLLAIVGADWKATHKTARSPVAISEKVKPKEIPTQEFNFHCPNHHGTLMEIYCKTCWEPLCWKCSFNHGKHNGHVCEVLDIAYDKCKDEIRSSLKAIATTLVKLDTRREAVSQQRVALEGDIHSTITKDAKKIGLISQLHQLTQVKVKSLAAQRDQIETIQAQLHKHLYFAVDTGSQGEAQQKKSTTIKQVQQLITTFKSDIMEPNIEADMFFVPPGDHAGENEGRVYALSSPDPSKCFIASEKIPTAKIGEESALILHVFNHDNLPSKILSGSLLCELVSEGPYTRRRGQAKERGRNLYEISYQPTVKGRHQLHITVEGQHIKGSPFPVSVELPAEKVDVPITMFGGLEGPVGVAINQKGEVMVTEWHKDGVSVFSPSGEKLRSFSSPLSNGRFYGIALDSHKNVLVTDRINHCIHKFTPQGNFLKSVGTEGSQPLQFNHPWGIAVNASNGKVYVVDNNLHIQVLNPDLSYFGTFGSKGRGDGQFIEPRLIAFDSSGNVWVTDWSKQCIQVFTAEGKFVRVFEEYGKGKEPYGIVIDARDNIYISDSNKHYISVYTPTGQFVALVGRGGNKNSEFHVPGAMTMDDGGNVYVCDCHYRIQILPATLLLPPTN